jgi:hypothetical protein
VTRVRTGAACAALTLTLAACGGGGDDGTPTPPITLNGVSYAIPDADLSEAELRRTRGGAGADIGTVIYVDDGTFEFLGDQSRRLDPFTTEFSDGEGAVALVTALPGYEDTRLIRQEFEQDGVLYISEGVIGRFTSDARMAVAGGSATYFGGATALVRGETGAGDRITLTNGDVSVAVDFASGRVNTTLDFRATPSAVGAPVDRIRIDGMQIDGNRFSGGTLTATKGGSNVPAYGASGSDLSSSGAFAGWNDATGAVAGGNRPAEVGGAFVATPGVRTLMGRYVAD